MGTHGQIHDVMVGIMTKHRSGIFGSDSMSYEAARKKGVTSIMATFPESKCKPACLIAQLDAYYKKKCTKQLPAVAGKKLKVDEKEDEIRGD